MRQVRPAPVPDLPTIDVQPESKSRSVLPSDPVAEPHPALPTGSRLENAVSVALMAGIAFLPIVIAAGFLAEHLEAPSVPREVSTAALRGPIDADRKAAVAAPPADHGSERPSVHVRAGF